MHICITCTCVIPLDVKNEKFWRFSNIWDFNSCKIINISETKVRTAPQALCYCWELGTFSSPLVSGFILCSGVFRVSALRDSCLLSGVVLMVLSFPVLSETQDFVLVWSRLFKAVYSRWQSYSELPLKLPLVPENIIISLVSSLTQ